MRADFPNEDTANANLAVVGTSSTPASIDQGTQDEKLPKSEEDLDRSSDALPADIEKGPENQTPAPVHQRPFLVEFEGPNDPGNPKSWTTKRRWVITISMGLLVFTVTFASSIFSVNISVVQQKFNTDLVTATLGVSLFVLVCSICTIDLSSRSLMPRTSGFCLWPNRVRTHVGSPRP